MSQGPGAGGPGLGAGGLRGVRAGGLEGAALSLTLCPTAHSVCTAGRWVCKDLPCPGTCALEGGSHIATFDGKKYTFHGDCYYVLAKVAGRAASGHAGSRPCTRLRVGRCYRPCPPQGDHDSYALLGELTPCGSTDKQTCLKTVVLLADKKKNVGAPAPPRPTARGPQAPPSPTVPSACPAGGGLQVGWQRAAE